VTFLARRHAEEEIGRLAIGALFDPIRELLVVQLGFILDGDRHIQDVCAAELGKVEFKSHVTSTSGRVEPPEIDGDFDSMSGQCQDLERRLQDHFLVFRGPSLKCVCRGPVTA